MDYFVASLLAMTTFGKKADAMTGPNDTMKMVTRRNALALGAGSLLGAPALIRSSRADDKTVYILSYGGVWETSWKKASSSSIRSLCRTASRWHVLGVASPTQGAGAEPQLRMGPHQSQ